MALLRREKNHGWVQYIEVLLVISWLADGLSYTIVRWVLDVPKTTVYDIVHRMFDAPHTRLPMLHLHTIT